MNQADEHIGFYETISSEGFVIFVFAYTTLVNTAIGIEQVVGRGEPVESVILAMKTHRVVAGGEVIALINAVIAVCMFLVVVFDG